MWPVSATVHQRALDDLASERGRREELTVRANIQQGLLEFLCTRVNQLEVERALMLRQLTNLEIPVPVLRPTVAPSPAPPDFMSSSVFDDDPANAPAGWHPDGTVNYAGRPVPGDRA